MESLVTELNVLLKLLDHETLSCATEEKKTAVKNLLRQLQPSGKYLISVSDGYYLAQAGFSGLDHQLVDHVCPVMFLESIFL